MPQLLKNSSIATPSQKFIDKFKATFGIDLLDGNWHDRLFSLQRGVIDFPILKFDRWLSRQDSSYDFENATCEGRPTSMSEYLRAKYSLEADMMVTYLTENNDNFETEFEFAQD